MRQCFLVTAECNKTRRRNLVPGKEFLGKGFRSFPDLAGARRAARKPTAKRSAEAQCQRVWPTTTRSTLWLANAMIKCRCLIQTADFYLGNLPIDDGRASVTGARTGTSARRLSQLPCQGMPPAGTTARTFIQATPLFSNCTLKTCFALRPLTSINQW